MVKCLVAVGLGASRVSEGPESWHPTARTSHGLTSGCANARRRRRPHPVRPGHTRPNWPFDLATPVRTGHTRPDQVPEMATPCSTWPLPNWPPRPNWPHPSAPRPNWPHPSAPRPNWPHPSELGELATLIPSELATPVRTRRRRWPHPVRHGHTQSDPPSPTPVRVGSGLASPPPSQFFVPSSYSSCLRGQF